MDTSYPNTDAYSIEAKAYKEARNEFILGMGSVILGGLGCVITLAMLMLSLIHILTLQDRLKEKDVPPEVSSLDFVRDIVTMVPTSANVRSYATIVGEKAVLRRLIKTTEEIANTCYAGKEPDVYKRQVHIHRHTGGGSG